MADIDARNSQSWQDLENDAVDRELDAAVATLVAVEPRAGLEQRVLANLRAQQERGDVRRWRRWPILAVTVPFVIVVMALCLFWRKTGPTPSLTARQRESTVQNEKQRGASIAADNAGRPASADLAETAPTNRLPKRSARRKPFFEDGPRLSQFPSLRPLSEQERILVRFVQEFPSEAAIIARAQAESEKEMEQSSGNQPPVMSPDEQDQ